MSTMASQITCVFIAQPFVQAQIKESIKAPCHWPLWGEFTGGGGGGGGPVNFPQERPVTRKMFPFDDVIMDWSMPSVQVNRRSLVGNKKFWCYRRRQPDQVVDQRVEWPVIWDAMTLIWHIYRYLCMYITVIITIQTFSWAWLILTGNVTKWLYMLSYRFVFPIHKNPTIKNHLYQLIRAICFHILVKHFSGRCVIKNRFHIQSCF